MYSVTQSCPTLCNVMDCRLPSCFCPWNFSGKNIGMGCHFLLQGIFPAQRLNLFFLQCLHWQGVLCTTSATWYTSVKNENFKNDQVGDERKNLIFIPNTQLGNRILQLHITWEKVNEHESFRVSFGVCF